MCLPGNVQLVQTRTCHGELLNTSHLRIFGRKWRQNSRFPQAAFLNTLDLNTFWRDLRVPQTSEKIKKYIFASCGKCFLPFGRGCPWVPSDIACIKLYQVVSTYIKLPRKCLQTTGSGSSKTSWQTSSLVTEWSTTIPVRKKLVRTWGCCGPKSMVVNGGKYGVILWSSYICNIDKDKDNEADGDDALAGGFRSQWVCVMIPPSLSPWAWILYSTFPDHVISRYVHQLNQFKPGIIHLVFTCFTKWHSIFEHDHPITQGLPAFSWAQGSIITILPRACRFGRIRPTAPRSSVETAQLAAGHEILGMAMGLMGLQQVHPLAVFFFFIHVFFTFLNLPLQNWLMGHFTWTPEFVLLWYGVKNYRCPFLLANSNPTEQNEGIHSCYLMLGFILPQIRWTSLTYINYHISS